MSIIKLSDFMENIEKGSAEIVYSLKHHPERIVIGSGSHFIDLPTQALTKEEIDQVNQFLDHNRYSGIDIDVDSVVEHFTKEGKAYKVENPKQPGSIYDAKQDRYIMYDPNIVGSFKYKQVLFNGENVLCFVGDRYNLYVLRMVKGEG